MKWIPRWLFPVIALVVVFLLASIALYMLGRSSTANVDTNGAVVQVAAKARLEWQRLMRGLYQVKFGDPAQQAAAVPSLQDSFKVYNDAVVAMVSGGSVQVSRNFSIELPSNSLTSENREIAATMLARFEELKPRLERALAAREISANEIADAFTVADAQDAEVSSLNSRLVGVISLNSFASVNRLNTLRLISTVLGGLFIGLLIALYSWQLAKIGKIKKETDEIMQTVPVGLFLLDKNLKLGQQHSKQLEKILGKTDLAGRDFSEVFGRMVEGENLATARDYLGLLISDQVDETLVADVNPLDRVDAVISNESGRSETRNLGFGFKRVVNNGKLSHLLVSVTDITEQVRLADQVSKLEKNADGSAANNLELMSTILSMDRVVLRDRLQRYEQLIDEANGHLKDSGRNNVTYQALVAQVFRPLHTLKGETAALGFKTIAAGAEDVETELVKLRSRTEMTGNDFLAVTLKLDELYDRLGKLKQLVSKLPEPPAPVAAPTAPARKVVTSAPVGKTAEQLAIARFDFNLIQQAGVRTADKLGKKITLQGHNMAAENVPEHLKSTVTDVLVQLVRNALAHGIETPAERIKLGKEETGKVLCAWQEVEGGFELLFRDDGAGLNFDVIRQRAVQLGKFSADAAAKLDAKQLAGLIFEPGFTTATKANDTAGQGVGLDVVMAAVKAVNGKIAVGTQPGQYTQFRVRFPN